MTKKPTTKAAEQVDDPRIEYVRLSELKPAKKNPKNHDLAAIAGSLKRHGFVAPAIENATTGRLVAGHGRIEALLYIKQETPANPPARVKVDGDEWLVPVLRGVAFKDERQAEDYLLSDNRMVELGGWDMTALGEMLAGIAKRGEGIVESFGWSAVDLEGMIAAAPEVPEEFPEVNPATIPTEFCCPKCSYAWSGSPDPAGKLKAETEAA